MAFTELRRGAREFKFRTWASKKAQGMPGTPETPTQPVFSEAFLVQAGIQAELDKRYASLTPTRPVEYVSFGQDRVVNLMHTDRGDLVLKTLKPTSRFNLLFGLGLPAVDIPPDTELTARERIVAAHHGVTVVHTQSLKKCGLYIYWLPRTLVRVPT